MYEVHGTRGRLASIGVVPQKYSFCPREIWNKSFFYSLNLTICKSFDGSKEPDRIFDDENLQRKDLPFCPKLAFLPQLQLQWQNGQQRTKCVGGASIAWPGKTNSSKASWSS